MSVSSWTEKIILASDGWGYRIGEGDEGEIVIYYFEEREEGKVETEQMRFYTGEVGEALLKALNEKYEEMNQCSN
jgi:hypothetical protein